MSLIKCLLVSLLFLMAGSRSQSARLDAATADIRIATGNISDISKLYAALPNIRVRDRVALSEIDVGLMLFLAAGLVTLQLRREQKRAGRVRLMDFPAFPAHPLEPLSRNSGELL